MAERAAESIVDAALAAFVVHVLIRRWRLRAPDLRLALWVVVLAVPFIPLAAAVVVPGRGAAWFRDRWALVDLARWTEVPFGGALWLRAAVVVVAASGAALFVADAIAFWSERLRDTDVPAPARDTEDGVAVHVAQLAGDLGVRSPTLIVLDDDRPHLLCAGFRQPGIVVSRGTIAHLTDEQLRAAIAHEMAHVRHRDGRTGWILMALRALLWFNPVVQIIARQAVHELECRADDDAAMMVGNPAAVVAALNAMGAAGAPVDASERPRSTLAERVSSALAEARTAAIRRRCSRLEAPGDDSLERTLGPFRVAITAGAVIALALLVV